MQAGDETLVFGWRTALLTLAGVQIAALAIAVALAPRNRLANGFLAALLAVIVGVLTPYAIGFAGFYDRWPQLSFAPFSITLALGPLTYAYVHALTTGRAPPWLWAHLAPPVVQFLYGAVMVVQPLAFKNRWDTEVDAVWVAPVLIVAVLGGLAAYCVAGLRLLGRYRAWLADHRSDDSVFAARWLGRVLAAMLAALAVWVAFRLWDAIVARLDYFGMFPLYLVLAGLAGYLAVEGWRNASRTFPPMTADTEAEPEEAEARWRELGARWAERTRAEGWAADPELSLSTLSARLGTNTAYLSRALNVGLGQNFSAFVNGLRSEAVAQAIRDGRRDDLLDLALEAGFASKASFNRAFRAAYGMAPSDWRARHASNPENLAAEPEVRRAPG